MVDRDIHYKDFWQMIRTKVLTMRELDRTFELLPQASVHQYTIAPVVPEKTIIEFERRNNLELPPSYRAYLLYFGAKGASAYSSTYHFELHTFQKTVGGPSKYIPFEGQRHTTEEDEELRLLREGTIPIAHGWNPVGPDLVLNGEGRGYVFWDSGDFIGCEGEFWHWYLKWTDKALTAINQRLTLKALPNGTDITEVQKLFPNEKYTFVDRYNRNCAFMTHDVPSEKCESAFILDEYGMISKFFNSRDALWNYCREC